MRAGHLDALRGIAVIWMVIFHACYDLWTFQLLSWDFNHGFWYAFPRVIAFTFLFCVGNSLFYTHTPKMNWDQLKKRSLKLGLAALVISLVTYVAFPTNWIYFGTLHCILAGSILGAFFVNYRKSALALMIVIILMQYGLGYDIAWVSSILKRNSMDFIPIYPWFWAVLLGIVAGPYLSKLKVKSPPFLTFLGRHSLKIYLIHQPVLFGIVWGISQLSK